MAPLELLLKRQAVVFKAPGAYIGPPAIYIGLERLSAPPKKFIYLVLTVCLTKIYVFLGGLKVAPDLYSWPADRYRQLEL